MSQPPQYHRSLEGRIASILIALLIAGFGYVVYASQHATTPTAAVQAPTDTAAAASQNGTWQTTHTYHGNGVKKTAIFSVPGDWKIVYTCNGIYQDITANGVLVVIVYSADNTPLDVAINAQCKAGAAFSTGETEEHQGGSIYLAIDGTTTWTIAVQELK